MKQLYILLLVALTGCSTVVPVKSEFPIAPKQLLEQCPALQQYHGNSPKDLMNTVIDNYGEYHICSNKVNSWIEWYNTQSNIVNGITK